MSILTPLQKTVIKGLIQKEIFKHFYLTGGTALAVFYLHHRYSDDLDFFTASENAVAQIANELEEVARKTGLRLTFGKRFETFLEVFLAKGIVNQRFESYPKILRDFVQFIFVTRPK